MSLQPTNRRWRKSLKGSYQPARRGSVVADSRHGSTQNVGPCVVRRRLERQYRRTRAPADRAAWVTYVRAMHRTYWDKEREHWEGLLLILNSPSGYGLLSTPCLDVDELTVRLILHLSQRKTT